LLLRVGAAYFRQTPSFAMPPAWTHCFSASGLLRSSLKLPFDLLPLMLVDFAGVAGVVLRVLFDLLELRLIDFAGVAVVVLRVLSLVFDLVLLMVVVM
jgi:hypothetical protein